MDPVDAVNSLETRSTLRPEPNPTEKLDTNGINEKRPQKKTLLSRAGDLWAKTGITWRVYKAMFKGALAPTIAIAAYQSTAWAEQYSTVGYLVGVMTVLSMVVQPRAKFLQTMLVQVILSCLSAALALLGCFFAIQARNSSEASTGLGGPGTSGLASTGAPTSLYNSSASAVSGVWLFVEMYGISVFRAHMPQFTIPCVMFAIITNVSLTYAPQFNTMEKAMAFEKHLLSAVLTGLAIATAVSLLVFPSTSRQLLFNDMDSFLSGLRAALRSNMTYLTSLEDTDMFAAQKTNTAGDKPFRSPQCEDFLAKIKAVCATQAKFAINLPFAKREIALGKLGPDDLKHLFKLFREILIPIVGLSCLSDMFERTSEERGWDRSKSFAGADLAEACNELEEGRIASINEWHHLIKLLKDPFGKLTDVIDEGLLHVAITLQLGKVKKQSKTDDPESRGDTPNAGDPDFAAHLKRQSEAFLKSKETMLRGWCAVHAVDLPEDFFSNPYAPDVGIPEWLLDTSEAHGRIRRQLMIVLFVHFLLYNTSMRIHDLVIYVDQLEKSGKLSKTRLVVPGFKRTRKWIRSLIREQDTDDHDAHEHSMTVSLGEAYKKKKDPEHLPPQDAFERLTDRLRMLARFFSSPASLFGVRVACATMCVAIVNYLRHTQVFFTTERLFWAQIMTSIAMAPSAGQSLRTFILRILGTTIAMVLSLIAWYIVDQNTAGVLVFYFLFLHIGMYIVVKHPGVTPVGMISMVTLTLIIGYELQVRKVGIQKAESNGQKYYPIYELAPIRLLTVAAGLFLAWVFTIFPYPITEHSQLRKHVGSTLYLLANFYSVVHETVQVRLRGEEGDPELKSSPGHKLFKVRHRIYHKINILLSGLRAQSEFLKYDLRVGGRFPKAQYMELIGRLQDLFSFISLVSIASANFSRMDLEKDQDSAHYNWVRNVRQLSAEANLTSNSVTLLLSLLSASLANGTALPPYLSAPEPYLWSQKLEQLDSDILSVRHIAEPGYASFAVIQLGTTGLIDDLKDVLAIMKGLVGELDFSFHVVSTSDLSRHETEETVVYRPVRAKRD